MTSIKSPLLSKFLLLGMVLLGVTLFAPQAAVRSAPTAVTFTAPGASGAVLAELNEFATVQMGDPWDMNEATDLSYYRSESQMTNSAFANGIYSARMTNGNGGERITLLSAGAQNNAALRTGKIGYNFPINAGAYRYLTYRIYKSNANQNSGLVQWYADDSYANASLGVSQSFTVPAGAGWHTIVVDLQSLGNPPQQGGKSWSGTIRELLLKPFAGPGAANAEVKLDWARLTVENPNTARPYTLRWNGGSGPFDLYASPGNKSLDANDILIASGVTGSSYQFQTGVLPAGDYYIAADDGSTVSWSSGALTINAMPDVEIVAPSMTSGEDYAADVVGNAWDMNQTSDLNDVLPAGWETCVSNPNFNGGIYSATLTGCSTDGAYTDARFIISYLNPSGPDPAIDTDKFRYFSFRYYQSGEQNVGEGWIARLGYWQQANGGLPGQDTVMSRDIIIHEGWNTYKIDLWASDLPDEASPSMRQWRDAAPNRLRFDPSELALALMPAEIKLDWIMLTAMDEVARGDIYRIAYNGEPGASYTFYYDTDTNPGNGRTLIGASPFVQTAVSPQTISADSFLYLPIVQNNAEECPANSCYSWNTSSVSVGTYYVCTEGDDGVNTLYRCSEAPLVVR